MRFLFPLFCWIAISTGKIHHVSFEEDRRLFIHLLDFGFLANSYLYIDINNLTVPIDEFVIDPIGFTLSKGDEVNELLKAPSDCVLRRDTSSVEDIVYLTFNFKNRLLHIKRVGPSVAGLQICRPVSTLVEDLLLEEGRVCYEKTVNVSKTATLKNDSGSKIEQELKDTERSVGIEPLTQIPLNFSGYGYSFRMLINFNAKISEGQYYLIYHNCHNYAANIREQVPVSYKATLIAKNEHSYLPAGEIINPQLYFGLAVLFFVTALFWIHLLKTTKDTVFKIHYLMAALVILKTLSLLFHGINYYFISTYGQQRAVWAVVYYIMHLLKGLMLFGVIILIGTGWTFFKNFLTDRDRKLFMIVIPLQVLDNIALIIKEESEIGQKSYSFWLKLFILIDLICCAAIILPVIWSIRHLQEASRTDGKAAFNLKKLKLFRHFYIIIICYIYLTRIVNYLVVFTVPFKFSYIVILVVEIGSWIFYVISGYKFKPAMNNPYLKLSQNEEDDDYEDVIMQSGALENVVRVNRVSKSGILSKSKEEIELREALMDGE